MNLLTLLSYIRPHALSILADSLLFQQKQQGI